MGVRDLIGIPPVRVSARHERTRLIEAQMTDNSSFSKASITPSLNDAASVTYSFDEAIEASLEYFQGDALAANVFVTKYALQDEEGRYLESTPVDMHRRLAREFARIEARYPNPLTEGEIFDMLSDWSVVPQGSPMSGVGNPYRVQTFSNCYVVKSPYDSYGGILRTDQQLTQIMKRRGGVGVDLSTLRPRGLPTANAAKTTDGIGVFMERFSNTTREVAQCLAADTLVLSDRGIFPIEKIRAGARVWTAEGWRTVRDVLKSTKLTQKITTRKGWEIRASADHVFHTIHGEIPVSQFSVGTAITNVLGEGWEGSPVSLEIPDMEGAGNRLKAYDLPTVLTEDLAYLIGQSYGDGSICEIPKASTVNHAWSIALSNDWPQITEKVKACVRSSFGGMEPRVSPGDGNCERLRIQSEQVVQFLKINGFSKEKSGDLRFPSRLLQASQEIVRSFIAGYFDADGYASGPKKGYVFSSASSSFLQVLKTVLAAHGIATSLYREDRSNKGWQDLYSLSVVGTSSQRRFIEFLGGESVKVSSLGFVAKRDSLLSIFTSKDLGVKYNKFAFCPDPSHLMSRNTVDRLIAEGVPLPPSSGRLVHDEVLTLEPYEVEDTYDLVLDDVHLFFANGLYAHNSGRRGALMLTVSVHHPDIYTFMRIKNELNAHGERTKVTGANVSIRLTNEFLEAVEKNEQVELRWPVDSTTPEVSQMVDASSLWEECVKHARDSAEPGLLFWDNILQGSPADCYAENGFRTVCTNPCAELPLSVGDSCRLLLVNLSKFVKNPFTDKAKFDFDLFREASRSAQRLMDDLVDLELEQIDKVLSKIDRDPEPIEVKRVEQDLWENIRKACQNGRRTGLGVTAVGDVLAMLGIKYGSPESVEMVGEFYRHLAVASYTESVNLAKERGSFPVFDLSKEKDHSYLNRVIDAAGIRGDYEKYGRRQIANLTTAPTGSVSILTQTTGGIEPVFMAQYKRRKKINPTDEQATVDYVDANGDKWSEFYVNHHGLAEWMRVTGHMDEDFDKSPYAGAQAEEIDWEARVDVQAAAGIWVDHSISSTINLPADVSYETVKTIYERSWKKGLKGITVYRDGCRSGVLVSNDDQITFSGHDAPKRPESLTCDVHRSRMKQGDDYVDWTIFVGLLDGKPYEIFGGHSENIELPKKVTSGWIVKRSFKSGGKYDFCYGEAEDPSKILDIVRTFDNPNQGSFTRMLSLSLRHGAAVHHVVEQLQRDREADMFSFAKVMCRVLKKYIEDGTQAGRTCPDCGAEGTMIYTEGCVTCTACGSSKCG